MAAAAVVVVVVVAAVLQPALAFAQVSGFKEHVLYLRKLFSN